MTEETEDVAGAAGGDGEMGDAELWRHIITIIGPDQAREWKRWWRRELLPAGRKVKAREVLGNLKIELDKARVGLRDPILVPGRWFVGEFCALAGIPRKSAGQRSKP